MDCQDLMTPSHRKAAEPNGDAHVGVNADAGAPPAADTIDRMAESFLASVDLSRLSRIRYLGSHDVISPARTKYVDGFRHWVWRNAQRIHEAELHRHPRRILELGSGGCIFAAMCRQIGHEVIATDKDHSDTIFKGLANLLGVVPEPLKVEAFQPLATGRWGRFDLVAAYALCFNSTRGKAWGKDQWHFFFEDLRRNVLAEGGRIILKFNHEYELWSAIDEQQRDTCWKDLRVSGRTAELSS